MTWPTAVANWLAAGNAPLFEVALVITPLNPSSQRVTLGFWSGMEDVTLTLGGVARLLNASYGSLRFDPVTYATGTTVRTMTARAHGLNAQAIELLYDYDSRFAPVEAWQLCFSQGLEFQGARRLLKGMVNSLDQSVAAKGGRATLTMGLTSATRAGTKSIVATKSHESYQQRSGDTAMEYAALQGALSDWWGPRGDKQDT